MTQVNMTEYPKILCHKGCAKHFEYIIKLCFIVKIFKETINGPLQILNVEK